MYICIHIWKTKAASNCIYTVYMKKEKVLSLASIKFVYWWYFDKNENESCLMDTWVYL